MSSATTGCSVLRLKMAASSPKVCLCCACQTDRYPLNGSRHSRACANFLASWCKEPLQFYPNLPQVLTRGKRGLKTAVSLCQSNFELTAVLNLRHKSLHRIQLNCCRISALGIINQTSNKSTLYLKVSRNKSDLNHHNLCCQF